MLEISGQGRTLLFVSHDMTAISKLCNKALEMSHGKVVPAVLDTGKGIATIDNMSSLMTVNEAISGYVLDGVAISERVWPPENAPSLDDGNVTLMRVAIENHDGVVSKSFDVKDDIFICIDFKVAQPKWHLNVHVYIVTFDGAETVSVDGQSENFGIVDDPACRCVSGNLPNSE